MTRASTPRPPGTTLRHAVLGVISVLTAFGLTAGGCATDAVGIDTCRDIETARCEAAQYCRNARGDVLIDDVAACKRFYRDHCLHGLAKGIENPSDDEVADCVATIEKAGQCAKDHPGVTLDECDATVSRDPRDVETACQIVKAPEWAAECSFLGTRGDLPPFDGGGGGQGGSP